MDDGASSYRRFLNGEEDAFDEIMEQLFHGLVCFIDRYVHDMHTAEDIAIDTFCDLIVHRHRYNFKVTLKTYLYMVGRSRALDHLKHRKVIRFVELSEAAYAPDVQEIEETMYIDERKKALNAALEQLPADMRAAVHLVYLEEMSYAQAARVMKKSQKQIDNLLYRAKKELRRILGEDKELFE